MPKFKVRFQPTADLVVRVEAEDYDQAIDKAYEGKPSGICAHCSGWREDFTLDVETQEGVEPYEVEDESGKVVWSEPTYIDMLQRQVEDLRKKLEATQKP